MALRSHVQVGFVIQFHAWRGSTATRKHPLRSYLTCFDPRPRFRGRTNKNIRAARKKSVTHRAGSSPASSRFEWVMRRNAGERVPPLSRRWAGSVSRPPRVDSAPPPPRSVSEDDPCAREGPPRGLKSPQPWQLPTWETHTCTHQQQRTRTLARLLVFWDEARQRRWCWLLKLWPRRSASIIENRFQRF